MGIANQNILIDNDTAKTMSILKRIEGSNQVLEIPGQLVTREAILLNLSLRQILKQLTGDSILEVPSKEFAEGSHVVFSDIKLFGMTSFSQINSVTNIHRSTSLAVQHYLRAITQLAKQIKLDPDEIHRQVSPFWAYQSTFLDLPELIELKIPELEI